MKKPLIETITLDKIVGGGQALGSLADGRKAFVWGGLPGETVTIESHKQKSKYVDGVVTSVEKASDERVEPRDPDSYLSTSPWQIMNFENEQHYKSALIEEAFEMQHIVLPQPIDVYTDGTEYGYRNKVEFSWWGDATDGIETLDIAFFRRGTQGKIPVEGTSLAHENLNILAREIRDILRAKSIEARSLKTLMIRCDAKGNCVFQLYVKDKSTQPLSEVDFASLSTQGGEVIYSDPKSPASVVTKRLATYGDTVLVDTVLGVPFRYAVDGFFQGNLAVYEQALTDMKQWVLPGPVIDMYSGVGSIGFTIGGDQLTLVEVSKTAVDEMKKNRFELGKKATIIEATSESSLDEITGGATIIVDPPRAGLHEAVIDRLLEAKPPRIIYLSCNPVTQARDVKYLGDIYGVKYHRGYNFFPRTPHIEHLVILDLK